MRRSVGAWVGVAAFGLASVVLAQGVGGQDESDVPQETEVGLPVPDSLVISKCSACHASDAKGNLSRISWIRATPEGWAEAVKRMVRLNGLALTPGEARSIVKALSSSHGLAPEEAKPVMYMAEHRMIEETIIPNPTIRSTCTSCHAFGKPMSWRRSKTEWRLLQNMHVALFEQSDSEFNRPPRRAGANVPAPTEEPEPGQQAVEYLAKAAPLHSAEWAAWRSRLRVPRLEGKWLVSAEILGRGKYVGELLVKPGPTQDEFNTDVVLTSLMDGSKLHRTGVGLIYTGYSWRGRSKGDVAARGPDDPSSEARETLWFAPGGASAEGRWYWGEYQEFGFDVKLARATAAPRLIAVRTDAVEAGGKSLRIQILGDQLPDTVSPTDLRMGAGITVKSIVSRSKTALVAIIDVDPEAISGKRDIELAGATLENAFSVYHRIDYIAVTPETALGRLGSDVHPKGYQQFEAIGFENGPDGKPGTEDDVRVGPVPDVAWSIEEFVSVYGDDDKDFVGQLSATGLFTPASDGPNPNRQFSRNNYGNVWVVATAKNESGKDGRPLSGRSYMVVTVPSYIRWDQPEVSQ